MKTTFPPDAAVLESRDKSTTSNFSKKRANWNNPRLPIDDKEENGEGEAGIKILEESERLSVKAKGSLAEFAFHLGQGLEGHYQGVHEAAHDDRWHQDTHNLHVDSVHTVRIGQEEFVAMHKLVQNVRISSLYFIDCDRPER